MIEEPQRNRERQQHQQVDVARGSDAPRQHPRASSRGLFQRRPALVGQFGEGAPQIVRVGVDLGFLVENVAQATDLLVVQVLDAQVRIDVRDRQDTPRGMGTNPEDVRESDLDTLLAGDVNASNSSHLPSYPCLWLCFGVTQMTRTWPPRLMTLHFGHIFLTDDRTFISLCLSYDSSTPRIER